MEFEKQREIAYRVIDLLETNYVFPDLGDKMGELVRVRLETGAYRGLPSPEFASALTNDLHSVNPDKHLAVRYANESCPIIENSKGPSPQVLAAFQAKASRSNFGFSKVACLEENIGYLDLRALHDPDWIRDRLAAAMTLLADTDGLILDLRENGGGFATTVALVCSYFLPEAPQILVNTIYFRPEDRTEEMWTTPVLDGPRYLDKPVFVLTSARTFSGAEELAYNLKHLGRATLVGETTRGGAHPTLRHRLDPHFTAAIPFARSINPITGTNWEGVGVRPHLQVAGEEAFEKARQLALQSIQKNEPHPSTKEKS